MMSNKRDFLQSIHNINPFSNGSLFDHRGGNAYNPPPPPVDTNDYISRDGHDYISRSGDEYTFR